jgi:hypothetical protein
MSDSYLLSDPKKLRSQSSSRYNYLAKTDSSRSSDLVRASNPNQVSLIDLERLG